MALRNALRTSPQRDATVTKTSFKQKHLKPDVVGTLRGSSLWCSKPICRAMSPTRPGREVSSPMVVHVITERSRAKAQFGLGAARSRLGGCLRGKGQKRMYHAAGFPVVWALGLEDSLVPTFWRPLYEPASSSSGLAFVWCPGGCKKLETWRRLDAIDAYQRPV